MNDTINITYTKAFDQTYRYDGKDLGAHCTKERTVFKIWSPEAEQVTLRLYSEGEKDGGVGEDIASARIASHVLQKGERGVFSLELPGDLHGIYYDYEILRYGEKIITADPYAVGCGVNGLRSMVTDLSRTNPEGFEQDYAPEHQTETIIYELHIKDFSFDSESGVPEEYRGKYKAFTIDPFSAGRTTGIAYLKKLGVTHVHLLPFYDYAAMDEKNSAARFNWGYDPLNYNVPEGSYSTDPYNGAVRIRECKEMIQALHQAGIRVVMDVVYNHTFSADSWLERTVPGYYARRWEDGSLTNGSGCGSDMAAGRAMVDNYIADSVSYWAREYHIDGFRFDLMGLLTTELMNRIREELDQQFGPNEILLYGEPWSAGATAPEENTHLAAKDQLPLLDNHIAVFCDDTRDLIKGHVFEEKAPGFVNGGQGMEEKVLQAVSAWRKGGSAVLPKSPQQIINYISAHDNLTLWDKLVISMKGEELEENPDLYRTKDPEILASNKLAALIYFSCQGALFFQAGEEFGRTKLGDENSYVSAPEINMLRWEQTETFADLVEYYKGLIRLRKQMPGFYDKSPEACERISQEQVHGEGVVSFLVDNRAKEGEKPSEWAELLVFFNASDEAAEVPVPEGSWTVLADGEKTDCRYAAELTEAGEILAAPHAGLILGR